MVTQEGRDMAADRKVGYVGIEIDAIDALEVERDMAVENVG